MEPTLKKANVEYKEEGWQATEDADMERIEWEVSPPTSQRGGHSAVGSQGCKIRRKSHEKTKVSRKRRATFAVAASKTAKKSSAIVYKPLEIRRTVRQSLSGASPSRFPAKVFHQDKMGTIVQVENPSKTGQSVKTSHEETSSKRPRIPSPRTAAIHVPRKTKSTATTSGTNKRVTTAMSSRTSLQPCVTSGSSQSGRIPRTMFDLKTWRFTCKESTMTSCATQHRQIFYSVLRPILGFLKGMEQQHSAIQLEEILKSEAHRIFGRFPVALMTLHSVLRSSFENMLQLYGIKNQLSENWQYVISWVAAFMAQRLVQRDRSRIGCIPKELHEGDVVSFDDGQLAARESCFIDEMVEHLHQLMCLDLKSLDSVALFDDSFGLDQREKAWTKVLLDFKLRLKKGVSERRGEAFEIHNDHSYMQVLLLSDIADLDDCLVEYCQVSSTPGNTKNCKVVSVKLHPEIVRTFSSNATPSTKQVDASKEDVDVLISLMYKRLDPMLYKGRITMGVYQLALHLKVANIWRFLFGEHPYTEFRTEENKLDLFRMLVIDGREVELTQAIQDLKTIFPGPERFVILNDLQLELAKMVLEHPLLRLDNLDKYKIIICWSFNKRIEDVSSALYDEVVKQRFLKLVVGTWRLGILQKLGCPLSLESAVMSLA